LRVNRLNWNLAQQQLGWQHLSTGFAGAPTTSLASSGRPPRRPRRRASSRHRSQRLQSRRSSQYLQRHSDSPGEIILRRYQRQVRQLLPRIDSMLRIGRTTYPVPEISRITSPCTCSGETLSDASALASVIAKGTSTPNLTNASCAFVFHWARLNFSAAVRYKLLRQHYFHSFSCRRANSNATIASRVLLVPKQHSFPEDRCSFVPCVFCPECVANQPCVHALTVTCPAEPTEKPNAVWNYENPFRCKECIANRRVMQTIPSVNAAERTSWHYRESSHDWIRSVRSGYGGILAGTCADSGMDCSRTTLEKCAGFRSATRISAASDERRAKRDSSAR